MVGATSETPGSVLGGTADDISGVDGTVITADDDQFLAAIGGFPAFSFQGENNSSPSASDATISVNENSANGTAVHTLAASDPDGDALTYTITAGNTGTAFAVNNSGQITVNNVAALDFEITPSFALTVNVSDGTLSDDAIITINLNDVNEIPSATDATVSLNENSANGTAVHTVSASDPDGDALTYTITAGNTGTAFAINNAGQITVNNVAALDFEVTPSFALTVNVSDGTLSDDAVITINLNDVNEAPSATDATVSLNENSANGTAVHTVSASDPDGDALTYAITGGNTNTPFVIDGSTGAVTVNNSSALDFESISSFSLTVTVSDGTLSDDAVITVNLNDINEKPSAIDATVSLNENAANGTAVHSVAATDPDGDALSYAITGGNTSTGFAINATTGATTVNNSAALDFEITSIFSLIVTVSDGPFSGDAIVTINLTNVNETPSAADATVSLSENAANGTVVHTVSSSDPDGDALTYTITGGNTSTTFAINNSGAISVNDAAALDYEVTPTYMLNVRVSDGSLFIEALITINLINANEAPSALDATVSLNENSVNATVVHTVSASDPEGDVLTYAITGGNADNVFVIDNKGVITVNDFTHLDFETSPAFLIRVRVSDREQYSEAFVTINLLDVNEAPQIEDAVITIAQNLPGGTVIHKVNSEDPDAGDTAFFSIEEGDSDSVFTIDGSTGELIFNGIEQFDQFVNPAFILTIAVRDAEGLRATAILTINVENAGEANAIDPLKGFSPDGDGINDFWLIKGIESFPDNEVKVFSRWGNLVFETKNYNNDNIAWRGFSNNKGPDTTYFFLITVEGLKPITGYVVVKE